MRKRSDKRMLWAVDHALGVSLIKASTSAKAIAKATVLFGTSAGPYRVSRNQPQAIAWAKAMGATER